MINCCSIAVRPHERDRQQASESGERIRSAVGGRDEAACTDAGRAVLALTEAVNRWHPLPPSPWGRGGRIVNADEKKTMSSLQAIADRVEVEALRGGCTRPGRGEAA
jgi:hypothetical protein